MNLDMLINRALFRSFLILLLPSLLGGCNVQSLGFFHRDDIVATPTGKNASLFPETPVAHPVAETASPAPVPAPVAAPLLPQPVKAAPAEAQQPGSPASSRPKTVDKFVVQPKTIDKAIVTQKTVARSIVPPEARKRIAAVRAPDFVYRHNVLTEDVRWHGEVLVEGELTIAPQSTLTIDPGTTIRFHGNGSDIPGNAVLLVQGRLVASGSTERPILFSSDFAEVRAGDWQGIILLASGKNNLMEHCTVEGAHAGLDASFSRIVLKNVRFSRCTTGAALHDSFVTVSEGGGYDCECGVKVDDSEIEIREAGFSGNRTALSVAGSSLSLEMNTFSGNEGEALTAENSRVLIRGNRMTFNGSALTLTGCEGSVADNSFSNNTGYGMRLIKSRLKVNANEIAANGDAGLMVKDGRTVVWGNILMGNGSYDLYNAGSDEITAIGNWWGKTGETDIAKRIYGRHGDDTAGSVRFVPALRSKPVGVAREETYSRARPK